MTTPFPLADLLVPPEPLPLPAEFTIVSSAMNNGLPHFIDLSTGLRLKVTLPTGLMQPWLQADPSALVATSADEAQPYAATDPMPIGAATRPALRMSIAQAGVSLATAPAVLAAHRRLPDAGDAAQGVAVEIVLLGWSIFAGTLQGPGDFGSFIQVGWKIANQGVSDFGPPVINPFLELRLIPLLRVQSQLGLVETVLDPRFTVRRLPLDVNV